MEHTERTLYEVVQVAGSKIKIQIDTGAKKFNTHENVIKIPNWPALRENGVLKSFGTEVDHADMANVIINIGVTSTEADIYVTFADIVPILGLKRVDIKV